VKPIVDDTGSAYAIHAGRPAHGPCDPWRTGSSRFATIRRNDLEPVSLH